MIRSWPATALSSERSMRAYRPKPWTSSPTSSTPPSSSMRVELATEERADGHLEAEQGEVAAMAPPPCPAPRTQTFVFPAPGPVALQRRLARRDRRVGDQPPVGRMRRGLGHRRLPLRAGWIRPLHDFAVALPLPVGHLAVEHVDLVAQHREVGVDEHVAVDLAGELALPRGSRRPPRGSAAAARKQRRRAGRRSPSAAARSRARARRRRPPRQPASTRYGFASADAQRASSRVASPWSTTRANADEPVVEAPAHLGRRERVVLDALVGVDRSGT